jgi:hypothetical protein
MTFPYVKPSYLLSGALITNDDDLVYYAICGYLSA